MTLDPSQPEARVALAIVHLHDGESEAAIGHLRSALSVAPNSVDALDWLGRTYGEVGRVDEAAALLERALAIDPELTIARLHVQRLRALVGDRSGMVESLTAIPSHPSDAVVWFMIHARFMLWERDTDGARRLKARLAAANVPEAARSLIERLLGLVLGEPSVLAELGLMIDQLLPIDPSRPPRRASFNAQMQTEVYLSVGDHGHALESLNAADANGLIDVLWIDRCPLFDPVRGHPEVVRVRRNVEHRAERVMAALDARLSQI